MNLMKYLLNSCKTCTNLYLRLSKCKINDNNRYLFYASEN